MKSNPHVRRRSLSYASGNESSLYSPTLVNSQPKVAEGPEEVPRKSARQRYASGTFSSRSRPGPSSNTLEPLQQKDEDPVQACSSNHSINIHSSDGFGGALTVTDISKIPWGSPGDIVEVKPARANTGRDGSAQKNRRPGENLFAARSTDETLRRKDRVKGNFLFKLRSNDEGQLRRLTTALSVSEQVSQVFPLPNRSEVILTKVEPSTVEADFIELYFTGQYLGRADMWRLGMSLEDQCVFLRQRVEFAGIKAEVKNIYIKGKRRASGHVTSTTKTIFRSKSAQSYLFLQLCKEMFDFDEDGERYYEKALYGFLPELFQRWKDTQANHVVTIIIFARVFYNAAEILHLTNLAPEGRYLKALQHDPYLGHYKDFYKVIVDFETRQEWHSIMPILKQQMLETHEEILLIYHIDADEAAEVKIMGRLGYAFEGNILECMNLVLNPFDESYIDRDLSRTGLSILVITPGVGHFAVNKNLLRLTTERLLDLGITLDLVCLAQLPLHVTPIFSFMSHRLPESKEAGPFRAANFGRLQDVLYYDAPEDETRAEEEHYSLAPWVYCSFYSRSYDKPFRSDRFVPRCKMHEIQMLGVIDHDLTTLSLPLLEPEAIKPASGNDKSGHATPRPIADAADSNARKTSHDYFDDQIFSNGEITTRNTLYHRELFSPGMSTPALSVNVDASGASEKGAVTPRPALSTRPSHQDGVPGESHNEATRSAYLVPLSTPGNKTPKQDRHPTELRSAASNTAGAMDALGGGITPKAKATDSPQDVPIVNTASTQADPGSPRSEKPTRSLTSKISRSTLSSISGLFKGLSSRSHPTLPITTVESIATTTASSSSSAGKAVVLETTSLTLHGDKAMIAMKNREQHGRMRDPISMLASPNKDKQPDPSVGSKLLDVHGGSQLLGTSQVEPVAIPIKGRPTDRRAPRRRSNPLESGSPSDKHQTSTNDVQKTRSRQFEREPTSGEGPVQVAYSLPTQRGGSSFPYGNSYKRSYMSSINPCRPRTRSIEKASKARRWQHALPRPTFTQDVKWDSLCAPACLPLTSDMVPKEEELKSQYHEQLYVFDCQANQLSFLLRPPTLGKQWDLPIEVLREMASQRLSQNFQFIVSSGKASRGAVLSRGDVKGIRSGGASDILKAAQGPLYLSTPNQVHRLDFAMDNRNTLEVHNYTRRLDYATPPMNYVCLVWPRQRKAYEFGTATFKYPTRSYDFNYLDRLISGAEEKLTEALRYWRTRFILIPSDKPPVSAQGASGETFDEQEIYITGATRLLDLISRCRWKGSGDEANNAPLRLLHTWLAPSACVTDARLMEDLEVLHGKAPGTQAKAEKQGEIGSAALSSIANAMRSPANGLRINDRWWQKTFYPDTFQGDDFVSWLLSSYTDIKSRDAAIDWGRKLFDQGLIEHCSNRHGFLDGYYYYRLGQAFAGKPHKLKSTGWFSHNPPHHPDIPVGTSGEKPYGLPNTHEPLSNRPKRKRKVKMSQTTILDLDPKRRSDRAEVAILHSDIIHNANNAFHFELNWIGVTAGLLDDMRQRWTVLAENHGLRLVEAPVEQIKDIGKKCAYRPCFPIRLALAPPTVEDLDERVPEQFRTANYFEYAILTQKFGFVLDVEATYRYPDDLEVEYSYRKAAVFEHSQFVHKSGLALVQCIGGTEGFLWSDNRLFFSASSRFRAESQHTVTSSSKQQQADILREDLLAFCADRNALEAFYATVLPPARTTEVIGILDDKEAATPFGESSDQRGPIEDEDDVAGPYGV